MRWVEDGDKKSLRCIFANAAAGRYLDSSPDEMNDLSGRPEGRDCEAHLADRLTDALIQYTDLSKPGPLVLETAPGG